MKLEPKEFDSIDKVLLQTMRMSLGTHKNTASAALLTETRGARACHIAAREKERLWLTFHHGPLRALPLEEQPVALHLFTALTDEPRSASSTSGRSTQ
jgi:hypothetical protein